jgi:hypothetical protein
MGVLKTSLVGRKREEVAGGWRTLHNEELHNLYASSNIIMVIKQRNMRWARHVARTGYMRNAYHIFVGQPDGKRALGRSRRRHDNNIRMDFREIRWEGVEWIHVAQDREQWLALLNTVMNLRDPKKAGNFLTS